MSTDTIISVEGVSKKFCRSLKRTMLYGVRDVACDLFGLSQNSNGLRPDEFWALDNVSFEVKRGECLGLIGPNGAGKSTLLKLLNGITHPDDGTIKVAGRVGALLELGAGFHPMLTGRENIYLSGAILGLSKDEIADKFDAIVDFAELSDFIDTPVKHYSSGMYVRLGFSVAINVDPEILFIDESLAVGDIGFQQKCLHEINSLQNQDITLVVVSHDIQIIKNYCSSALYLRAGKISFQGHPETATEIYLKDLYQGRQLSMGGKGCVVAKRAALGRTVFGTKHGEILDASLWRGDEQTTVFCQGEPLTVKIVARVDESIVNPEVVMQIRDTRGYTLYGIDSLSAGLSFPCDERDGGIIQVEFAFEASLAPGDFAIALGLNDRVSEGGVKLHEKLVGSLTFAVIEGSGKFHGAVDLKARCKRSQFSSQIL